MMRGTVVYLFRKYIYVISQTYAVEVRTSLRMEVRLHSILENVGWSLDCTVGAVIKTKSVVFPVKTAYVW